MPPKTLSHAEASLLCFESDALNLQKNSKFFILVNRSYRGKYSLLILIFGQLFIPTDVVSIRPCPSATFEPESKNGFSVESTST